MKTSCIIVKSESVANPCTRSAGQVVSVRTRRTPLARKVASALAATVFATGLAVAGAEPATSKDAESPVTKINAEAATANIEVQHLRGNITVLMGSGGNISVLTGREGKLMVDGGIGVSRPRLSQALNHLGSGPLKYLIDTHWHWDHTDGNEWLHQTGATIIAQENTLKRLSETVRVEDWSHTFPPSPVGARPTVLVQTDKTLDFDGDTLVMHYYGPCHTDSDMYVYFKKADVLATGDTYWNGVYPFIDIVTGGSIDGMIRAANVNIDLITDNTIVVGGHGPVGNRAGLIEYRDMLAGIRKNVAALKKQGKSLEQAIAAKPTAVYDAKWGQFVISPALFTSLVYRGV
jgi:glyoxylase-like metal-dependent hydrolase (beta-lactamase superfamily II)